MKILNLYAGIGGNRKLWGDEHEVTAVEYNKELADIYKSFYPNDNVIVDNALQYLIDNYKKFDFIWSSPSCPSHSKIRFMASKSGSYKEILPDMTLWQQIIFLKHFCKCKWVVENVKPYYDSLINPNVILERHCFWSNFNIEEMRFKKPEVKHNKVTGKTNRFGISLEGINMKHRKDQIIRNCVNPEIGLYVLKCSQIQPIMLNKSKKEVGKWKKIKYGQD